MAHSEEFSVIFKKLDEAIKQQSEEQSINFLLIAETSGKIRELKKIIDINSMQQEYGTYTRS